MDLSLSLPLPIQKRRRRHSSSSNNPPFPPSQPPEDGVDRLTALPDPLRIHILSLLPLSAAIRTGTLSSHWKDLWKTRHPHRRLTKIHLNLAPVCLPTPYLRGLSGLLLEPGKLFLSFHLSFVPQPQHLQLLQTVLHNAAACGVADLSLDLRSSSSTFRSPSLNFSISANLSSLVRLSLSGFHLSRLSSYFKNFLNLEYLIFCRMNISDTIFRMIVAGCPQLRTLDVRKCPDLKKVVVVGRKIVNVTVVDCPQVIQVVVRSKILNKFHFKGRFAGEYRLRGAENLKDVYMCSDVVESEFPMSNWVAEVHGLRHVRVLTLCSFSLQYMMAADTGVLAQFQTLDCLRELQLLMFFLTEENQTDIYKFFRLCQCPNLERLFIELPTKMHDPYMEKFLEVTMEEPLPLSIFANLKTIKINGFKGHHFEMRLVRFFWSNSINLESLTIVCPREREEEECSRRGWDIYWQTLQFLRENVKIVVIEDDDHRIRPTHEAYCNV